MHTVKAEICWLSLEEGGREEPPSGPSYSTVAKFEEYADRWPSEAWSIVAEFDESANDSMCITADVRFLAEGAPSHLLKSGQRFELYEGDKMVAVGKVIG